MAIIGNEDNSTAERQKSEQHAIFQAMDDVLNHTRDCQDLLDMGDAERNTGPTVEATQLKQGDDGRTR